MMRRTRLPHLTVQQLEYLVAVADEPTWAVAATSLGVSPSALSQGVAEFERRLGFEVFERVGRRRAVAPAAAPVVEYARRVLAETSDLTAWVAGRTTGETGSVRVGMIDAAAVGHYPTVLLDFRRTHPDVDFSLTVGPSAHLLGLLERNELDLAVLVPPPVQPVGIAWVELMGEPLAVYAPEGAAVRDPHSWGPWIAFPSDSHTRRLITAELVRLGAPVNVVAESHQPDVVREMVRLGLGWAVLPVIQAETQPNPLERVRPEPLLTRVLVAARRAAALANPLADQLVDRLRQPKR